MFCLSLVCQSYDLEWWILCCEEQASTHFSVFSAWTGGSWEKLQTFLQFFKVEESLKLRATLLLVFFACSVSLQLLSIRANVWGVWGDKSHRFFAFSLFEAQSFANLCWWTCQVELSRLDHTQIKTMEVWHCSQHFQPDFAEKIDRCSSTLHGRAKSGASRLNRPPKHHRLVSQPIAKFDCSGQVLTYRGQ